MNYLRLYRVQARMSQQALSEVTGISQPTISHYENGLRLLYPHARAISQVLGDQLGIKINPLILDEPVKPLGTQNDPETTIETSGAQNLPDLMVDGSP